MSELHHHHDEECGCGHEHHHHDEECGCGHEHHHHDEECGCGHEHHHHDEEETPAPVGEIRTKVRLHDDAKVISGSLRIIGDYNRVRAGLEKGLTEFAAAITEKGGVVGHIKASCEVKGVEMFSVTDVDVMIKTAPEQDISIILAAIVFFVTPEEAEELARKALNSAL